MVEVYFHSHTSFHSVVVSQYCHICLNICYRLEKRPSVAINPSQKSCPNCISIKLFQS
jgi:hypothetical protein